MKTLETSLTALALALVAGLASAQPASAPGPGASAPGRMGMGMGRGMRMGPDNTAGWSMMTPQERAEHQERMRTTTTRDECRTLRDQHHEQMVARAKEKGLTLPAKPRRDACTGFKP